MKAKTKFLKMYYKLPKEAKIELIYDAYRICPMSMAVVAMEVKHDTQLSKEILKKLGYEDN